ncbi:unnamed protein product [Calypogeia fissa]
MFWLIDVDTSRRYLEAAIKQSARQISHVFPQRGKTLCGGSAFGPEAVQNNEWEPSFSWVPSHNCVISL